MTAQEEDALIGEAVIIDDGSTGILCAIFTDGYDTTAGSTRSIRVSDEPAKYLASHADRLPVDWHSKVWLFPDGKCDMLVVNWDDTWELHKASDMSSWEYVVEVRNEQTSRNCRSN